MKSPREDPKAVGDSSRGIAAFSARFRRSGALGPVILALGVAAAVLMVVAEVSTIFSIDVGSASCQDLATPENADTCEKTGLEQHSYALVVLGVLAATMAVGAGLGGSRPAGMALLMVGLIVVAIWLLGDLPDATSTGELPGFEPGEAERGTGFWLELAAGVLAVVAGGLRLIVRPRPDSR